MCIAIMPPVVCSVRQRLMHHLRQLTFGIFFRYNMQCVALDLRALTFAAKAICKERYLQFGCEGQGAKIKGDTLHVVAEKYAKGELAQVVH